jgi:hypothetical protein
LSTIQGQSEFRDRTWLVSLLAAVALLAPLVSAAWLPAFAQPASYHHFADQRSCLGLPYAANVLSNLPFLLVGWLGLAFTLGGWRRNSAAFRDARDTLPWTGLFTGVALTAFGSAYYHWNPNDATLVWDRLPMALGFAGLVAGTLADRAELRHGNAVFVALAMVATGSVIGWSMTRNLTPYLVVQVGFIAVAVTATALLPSRYSHGNMFYAAAALYGLAFLLERFDWEVKALTGGVVSGHTLKHLAAAAAVFVIYLMLKRRSPQPLTAGALASA